MNHIQKYIINDQMYLNIYNMFYPQYSAYHISEQGIRNVENEIIFTMA